MGHIMAPLTQLSPFPSYFSPPSPPPNNITFIHIIFVHTTKSINNHKKAATAEAAAPIESRANNARERVERGRGEIMIISSCSFCVCLFIPPPPSLPLHRSSLASGREMPSSESPVAAQPSPPPTTPPIIPWHQQWLTLGVLASANLCLGITLSCIVPFFPAQAKAKGLSTAQIGLIIGFYQLGGAISSPLLGRSMARLGPRHLFSAGLCLAASAVISFGWLPHLASPAAFFWSALALRALMALGLSAYKCSQTTILAQQFPQNLATIGGLLDTFSALTYALGPILGSALTQLGGYSMPFAAFGLLMFLAGLASIWLLSLRPLSAPMPTESTGQNELVVAESGGGQMRAVLAVPEVWLTGLGVASLMLCCFFYDASLAEHIARVDPSPMLTGTLISVTSFTSMLGGPLCGFLIDRNPRAMAEPVMFGAAIGGALFALMIGPSPLIAALFHLNLSVLFVAFAIQGASLVAMNTPSLRHCLRAAKERGLDTDSAGTCGCISGLIQGSVSLGAFLGNTLGALSVQKIGFEWTATLVAAFQLPFIIGLIFFKTNQLLRWPFGQKDAQPLAESRRSTEDDGDDGTTTMLRDCHPVSAI